jgi:hypothetical protein
MNSLSTKLTKLDLDVILKNYCQPAFWKQTWQIYKHGDVNIIARIHTIDVFNNKIYMKLNFDKEYIKFPRIKKTAWAYCDSEYITIPIDNPDYKKDNFENSLLSASLNLIYNLEEHLILDYSEYKEADKLEEAFKESLKEIAGKFLDDNNVTNDKIREAYIDNYVYRKCKIPKYTADVIEKMHYTVLPSEYLLLISFFNNEKSYEEYSKKCKKLRKSIKLEMWADGRKLDTPEFVNRMKEKLEAI